MKRGKTGVINRNLKQLTNQASVVGLEVIYHWRETFCRNVFGGLFSWGKLLYLLALRIYFQFIEYTKHKNNFWRDVFWASPWLTWILSDCLFQFYHLLNFNAPLEWFLLTLQLIFPYRAHPWTIREWGSPIHPRIWKLVYNFWLEALPII